MQESTRWTIRAAKTHATVTGVSFFCLITISFLTSGSEGGRFLPAGLLLIVGTCITGIVGGATWALIVERIDQWSIPLRGALAGGLTGWLILPTTLLTYLAIRPPPAGFDIGVVVVSLLAGMVTLVIIIGWLTIPMGAVVGYWLGRQRVGDNKKRAPE